MIYSYEPSEAPLLFFYQDEKMSLRVIDVADKYIGSTRDEDLDKHHRELTMMGVIIRGSDDAEVTPRDFKDNSIPSVTDDRLAIESIKKEVEKNTKILTIVEDFVSDTGTIHSRIRYIDNEWTESGIISVKQELINLIIGLVEDKGYKVRFNNDFSIFWIKKEESGKA